MACRRRRNRSRAVHFVISATWGPTDPTRAMLPFLFAASALQAGDRVMLMLFHDAVYMAVEGAGWMFDVTSVLCRRRSSILGRPSGPSSRSVGGIHGSGAKGAERASVLPTKSEPFTLSVLGWVRMREAVRFCRLLKPVTISRDSDRWFASIIVETDDIKPVDQPSLPLELTSA
jgi:hypothetical protein